MLIAAAFFTARVPFDERLAFVSTLFTLVLFLPAAYTVITWLGWLKGGLLLVLLGAVAVVIETLAIQTGIPYGKFVYNAKTGIMISDIVPLSTPFAWIPIVVGSAAIASKLCVSRISKIIFTALLMVWVDLLLDPIAVTLGLWRWVDPGVYFGVPLLNYAGWLLTSLVGSVIFYIFVEKFADTTSPPARLIISLYIPFIFWLALALFLELYLPFMLGLLFLVVFARHLRQTVKKFMYV